MTVKWQGDAMRQRIEAAAMQGVVEWIGLVEERAVQLILDTPKSGIIYRRRGTEHRASAPGEPPASDTGNLVNNRRIDLFPARLAARLTFSSAYAWFLQNGTQHIEPRPWADRALSETEAAGRDRVASSIRAALQ